MTHARLSGGPFLTPAAIPRSQPLAGVRHHSGTSPRVSFPLPRGARILSRHPSTYGACARAGAANGREAAPWFPCLGGTPRECWRKTMEARVSTFTGPVDRVGELLQSLDRVAREVQQLGGFQGADVFVRRSSGTVEGRHRRRTVTALLPRQASDAGVGRAGTAVGGRISHGFSNSLSTSVVGSKPRVHHLAR